MSKFVNNSRELLERFKETTSHAEAASLAFKIVDLLPGLLAHVDLLSKAKDADVKHTFFKCETCDKPFKVYFSQMKTGSKSGRFCSFTCYKDSIRIKKEGTPRLVPPTSAGDLGHQGADLDRPRMSAQCDWCGEDFAYVHADGVPAPLLCSAACVSDSEEALEEEKAEARLRELDEEDRRRRMLTIKK